MSISEQITRIQNEVSSQENLITQIATALEGKAGGSSSSAEWIDVLSLPTTYVVAMGDMKDYYVEKGENFKALIVRYAYPNNKYCSIAFKLSDENMFFRNDKAAYLEISSVDGENNILKIAVSSHNGVPNFTSAEYLLIN